MGDLVAQAKPNQRLQGRLLTRQEFLALTDVPPEVEWLANISNDQTRRAYRHDIAEFGTFVGISTPAEFRMVTRAHVIAWRSHLKQRRSSPATIRRKLAALSSFYR